MDSLHFVLADLSAPLIEEWRHAFTQHLPENLRGNISIIHSKLADLTPPVNQVLHRISSQLIWPFGWWVSCIFLWSL